MPQFAIRAAKISGLPRIIDCPLLVGSSVLLPIDLSFLPYEVPNVYCKGLEVTFSPSVIDEDP